MGRGFGRFCDEAVFFREGAHDVENVEEGKVVATVVGSTLDGMVYGFTFNVIIFCSSSPSSHMKIGPQPRRHLRVILAVEFWLNVGFPAGAPSDTS